MADRTDVDALLISALYGELTSADEARLTAHLESHPADRTALADLTHTRATVRESRILAVQFDPPQSVSALLLREAARRAPKQEGAIAGWFHRFTRSFMMHPAMAAAAMLVLVVGVAGTLYVRRGDQFAETPAPAIAADHARAKNYAQEVASAETAPEPTEIARGVAEDKGNAPTGGFGSAAGSDAYRVALDEPAAQPAPSPRNDRQGPAGRAKDQQDLLADREENQPRKQAKEAKEDPRGGDPAPAVEQRAKPTARPLMSPKLAKKGAGIELRSPQLEPKDFDDEQFAKVGKKDAAKRELGNADGVRASTTIADNVEQAPGAATTGGGGATAVPGMMPPQNHAAAPVPAADPAAVASITSSNGAKSKAPTKAVLRSAPGRAPSAAPSLQPPPPPVAAAEPPSIQRDNRRQADKSMVTAVDAKPAEEKTSEDKALAAWAQKQREQVLAFVKSNNCRAAANAAVAIYNRAPDYYATNIATDRSIKPCIAYVNNEREREDRSRAALKRANATDTPAQAAPPPARK